MKHFFRRKSSCQVAKDRLKILLISDRVNCSPEMMELIKNDIARVISKYMKIDADNMEIQINCQSGKNGRNWKDKSFCQHSHCGCNSTGIWRQNDKGVRLKGAEKGAELERKCL